MMRSCVILWDVCKNLSQQDQRMPVHDIHVHVLHTASVQYAHVHVHVAGCLLYEHMFSRFDYINMCMFTILMSMTPFLRIHVYSHSLLSHSLPTSPPLTSLSSSPPMHPLSHPLPSSLPLTPPHSSSFTSSSLILSSLLLLLPLLLSLPSLYLPSLTPSSLTLLLPPSLSPIAIYRWSSSCQHIETYSRQVNMRCHKGHTCTS